MTSKWDLTIETPNGHPLPIKADFSGTLRVVLKMADLQPQEPAFPCYNQRDEPWRNDKLGYSNISTIGTYGCLITCVAMVASHATGEAITPPIANERLKAVGGFVPGEANMYFAKVVEAFPELKLAGYHKWLDVPAKLDKLNAVLDRGGYCIIRVDFDPGDETRADPDPDQHWCLVTGREGEVYNIIDPWDGGAHLLPPAYCRAGHGWDAARAIYAVSMYERKAEG